MNCPARWLAADSTGHNLNPLPTVGRANTFSHAKRALTFFFQSYGVTSKKNYRPGCFLHFAAASVAPTQLISSSANPTYLSCNNPHQYLAVATGGVNWQVERLSQYLELF